MLIVRPLCVLWQYGEKIVRFTPGLLVYYYLQMAKLSKDDVLKLARLSRLRLSEDEIAQFQGEISEILNFVEQLSEVDTAGLEPTSQVTGLTNVMRKDEIIDYGTTREGLLKNAPAVEKKQFKVKRVLG